MPKPVSIAIVGCGAVVEQYYLPALRGCRSVRCDILVDSDPGRAEELARRYGIGRVGRTLDDVPVTVEGMVVAVPNRLHVEVVARALGRGAHVLCEKPLGRTAAEVREIVAASEAAGRSVFAAMVCRRYPAIAEAVAFHLRNLVADLQEIDASYGFPLDWPVKSTSYYDKAQSGGGALLDFGAHLVDALLFVLGDPVSDVVAYADDAEEGVDAEAKGRISVTLPQGPVPCTVRASRLRKLPNAITLRSSHAELRIPMSAIEPATLRLGGAEWAISTHAQSSLPCFTDQLEDFGRAIREVAHTLPTASSQVSRACLIDRLYHLRSPLVFAWDV